MTAILIAYQEQAWTTEAAFLASSTPPAERVLVFALDTGKAWLGDGTTLPASLTPVVYPGIPLTYLDTDTTMAADSNTRVPSQHAVKTLIASSVAGLLDYKGGIDCSANPNFPAALKGDTYFVTVAGKIGGASGTSVDVSDMIVANADNAGGTLGSVGTSWNVFEHNLVGALLAANNLSDLGSPSAARTNLGLVIGTDVEAHDADLTAIAGLSPSNDDVIQRKTGAWTNRTMAQLKTDLALVKGDVGLGNVDNTSDATKNIGGTAANLSGTPALPNGTTATTQSAADNSTKLATTAYVDSGLSSKAPTASPTFTGTVTLPTGLTGVVKAASGVVSAGSLVSGDIPNNAANTTGSAAKLTTARTIGGVSFDGSANISLTSGSGVQKGDGSGGLTAATAGTDYTSPTSTETQTNKRKQPRVNAQTSTSTLTPEIDTYDVFRLTAQAAALTIANHSTSTPADGEQMRISILDNGTARAISFGTNYVARAGVALPTTTVISKLMTLGFEWYAHLSKWVLMANASET